MRNTSKPQLPGVHLPSLRWGDGQTEDMCPRPRPRLFSNSLKQTWPWDSKGRTKGVAAGKGPGVRRQQAERGHNSGSSVDTGRQLQTMQQQGYFRHGSHSSHPQLSCLQGRRHCTCNSVQRKILVDPAQAHPEKVGALSWLHRGKQAFGYFSFPLHNKATFKKILFPRTK